MQEAVASPAEVLQPELLEDTLLAGHDRSGAAGLAKNSARCADMPWPVFDVDASVLDALPEDLGRAGDGGFRNYA